MPRVVRIYAGWFAVAALAAVIIYTGHGPHALNYLPFLIILACPLMHIFMHHGHGHHSARERSGSKGTERT